MYVSAADWNLMENPPARGRGGRGPAGPPTQIPRHDAEIKDGEPIVLGDFSVTPVAVPGHTPGSMGFVFPVQDNGRRHMAALFGGAWLTPQILSDEALQTFLMSVLKFKEATKRARVDVVLQNHMLMDPIQPKLDAIAARKPRDANPFIVGPSDYQRFLGVMEGCTRVNLARRMTGTRGSGGAPAAAPAAQGQGRQSGQFAGLRVRKTASTNIAVVHGPELTP